MAYWLVKEEPGKYPFSRFQQERETAWTGVRNYQARNHLRAMQAGDEVVYYHTGGERQAVGLATVSAAAYADPTAREGDWSCVDLTAGKELPQPVPLKTLKQEASMAKCLLVRNSRLSVVPLSTAEYRLILKLAQA